jgi:hypothetical protein
MSEVATPTDRATGRERQGSFEETGDDDFRIDKDYSAKYPSEISGSKAGLQLKVNVHQTIQSLTRAAKVS